MKILFYAKHADATEFFRVKTPAKYLAMIPGVEVKTSYTEKSAATPNGGVRKSELEWCDIVVFQRPVVGLSECFKYIKDNFPEKPIVGDYDDDYFSVPRWNPGFPRLKMNEKEWQSCFNFYDGVTASTEPLAEVFSVKVKEDCLVRVIENSFDSEMFDEGDLEENDFGSSAIQSPDPNDLRGSFYSLSVSEFNQLMVDKTVCCWAGSHYHYVDLDWFAADAARACEENPDLVFIFVGFWQRSIIEKIPVNRIYTALPQLPISRFYDFLKQIKIDIMMAPLDPCTFNQSKSNLKFMEACHLGALPVCSEWDPYEKDLDPELSSEHAHGYLAGYEKGDWAKSLAQAVVDIKGGYDPSFNNAYCRSVYAPEVAALKYVDFFKKLIDLKKVSS